MKLKTNINLYYLIFLNLFLFISCSNSESINEMAYSELYPLKIYAGIDNNPTTKAVITNINDEWSYIDFAAGDRMGIYASGGNGNIDGGRGVFNNQELIYNGSQFNDPDNGALFSPTHMKGSEILMYFPYNENTGSTGMTLRTPDKGVDKCIDLLSSSYLSIQGVNNGKDMALFGEFKHEFSEIIILRGEGFDNPPEGDNYRKITAVMSKGYTHYKITMEDNKWPAVASLYYVGSEEMKEDAKRWTAWKGGNYGITLENEIGRPAWYVILPTLGISEDYTVEYIELYDNEGYLQRVSSVALYKNSQGQYTKYLEPSHIYPVEITMKELVPTVNPFPILPWEEDVNLTDQRERGINNLFEFQHWVSDYNAYLLDMDDEVKQNNLLKYGDKYVDTSDNISWHFYILSDIDLSSYTAEEYVDEEGNTITPDETVIIPKLNDILDGLSVTFVNGKFLNNKITGLSKTFIGEMGMNNGSLQNIDFINPNVILDESNTSAKGIIANSMVGASVINCNVEMGTLFNPGGPVGMVSGTINNGTVKNCSLSGFMSGSSTSEGESEKIIGVNPTGTCVFENNDIDITYSDGDDVIP